MKALTAARCRYKSKYEHSIYSPYSFVGGKFFHNCEIYPFCIYNYANLIKELPEDRSLWQDYTEAYYSHMNLTSKNARRAVRRLNRDENKT